MRSSPVRVAGVTAAVIAFGFAAIILVADTTDPLAVEIEKWTAFLESDKASGEFWEQIKPGSAPVLARAAEALRGGQRMLAMQRFAAVHSNLEAAAYLDARPAEQRREMAGFEEEWKRVGRKLDLRPVQASAVSDIQPAAVRALAETALPQVRVFYEASLEYGRSTTPDSGLFYLGSALAQRDFIGFARKLAQKTPRQSPPLRSLRRELDSLEGELLAAYRPPASINRHPEFIGASSMLKEARELDDARLYHGAMLRYLEAVRRTTQLRDRSTPDRDAIAAKLKEYEALVAAGPVDHSIAQFYVEAAAANLDSATPLASAIVTAALPRYFAALAPASAAKAASAPAVTVTLVRWPYT